MAKHDALKTASSTAAVVAGLTMASLIALPVAASATSAATSHAATGHGWFHDPLSATARRAEIAVPTDPSGFSGALRHTVADFRTHSGALAVPVRWAHGHVVVRPEALTLNNGSLFVFNSAALTQVAHTELARLSSSLTYVTSVRCEGYTDFGGTASHEHSLSVQRAQAVCALVHKHRHSISTTSVGYGGTQPVVVGGTTDNRVANRRVVIVVTSSSALPPVATSPSAPRLSKAVAGDTTATITFAKPARNGGAAITGYQVSTNAGHSWRVVTSKGASPFRDTLRNLTNDKTYTVSVRATNSVGHGNASNRLRVMPESHHSATVPSSPTLTSESSGNGTISVTFTAPTSDGGAPITGYQVSLVEGQNIWVPVSTTGSSPYTVVITGLTNGTSYPIVIRAVNSAGDSLPSNSMSMIPRPTAPSPPLLVSATPGNGFATVTFNAAQANGSPITGYQVSSDQGDTWSDATISGVGPFTATIPDLTDGAIYGVEVRAVNSVGPGASSNSIAVTPFAVVPGAPILTAATAGDGSASLTFTAPASDGGAAITGYEVSTVDAQDVWAPVTTTGSSPFSVTVSGLTDGNIYPIVVRAVNSAGDSLASNSLDVTPVAPPVVASAPTILTGIPNYGPGFFFPTFATLTFTTPTTDGGSPITSYQLSLDNGMSWQTVTPSGTPNQVTVFANYVCGQAPITDNFVVRAETSAGDGLSSADFPLTLSQTSCFLPGQPV